MSDDPAVPPSATSVPMTTATALKQYSEMLDDIEGCVDEGVYLKVCNAGMNLHRAKRADLLAGLALGGDNELAFMQPAALDSASDRASDDEASEADYHVDPAVIHSPSNVHRALQTVRMVHSVLLSTLDENKRLSAANGVLEERLGSAQEAIQILKQSGKRAQKGLEQSLARAHDRSTFLKNKCEALNDVVRKEGVSAQVLAAAYLAHGVPAVSSDQACAQRKRTRFYYDDDSELEFDDGDDSLSKDDL